MKKKAFTLFIIILVLSTLFKCSLYEKDKIGVSGYVVDDQGNSLGDVFISYKTDTISVQTDSSGDYTINTSRTIFMEFKKEGYQTLVTKIDNFSEESSYDLKTVVLKKTQTKDIEYRDIYKDKNTNQQNLKLSGKITTIFNSPIKNAKVTLIDSAKQIIASSNTEYNKGSFSFRKYSNKLLFEKKGYRDLQIELPTYEKDFQQFSLLEESNRKGVYLIKSNKYIRLPKTKLRRKSDSKETTYLLVFAGRYSLTDYFYPNKTKEFKIKKNTLNRFAIFDPNNGNKLCYVKDSSNYLCTVKNKYGPSFVKGNFVKEKIIYPSNLCINCSNEPLITEFETDTIGSNYVFVDYKNNNGYYFSY